MQPAPPPVMGKRLQLQSSSNMGSLQPLQSLSASGAPSSAPCPVCSPMGSIALVPFAVGSLQHGSHAPHTQG